MDLGTSGNLRQDDLLFLGVVALVAAGASLAVFSAFLYWFRREQSRSRREIIDEIARADRDPDELFFTGKNPILHGELVAQFKVNQGKQVVSLLESDGKRFLHVDGKLSAPARARMVRYLKSEGFMS